MIIDTNDERAIQEYEERKYDLIWEKREKGSYDSSDIFLVRVTDHLPEDSFIPATCNTRFLTNIRDLSSDVVFKILRENEQKKTGHMFLEPEVEDQMLVESKKYSPLSTQYRSSVHFTLNGVVEGNRNYGVFDSPFVIIEPFKHHEDDSNILAVRGDDTYFKDGISLSSDSVVLLPVEYKGKVDESSMNVVFYKGDRNKAVEMYLVENGIVPEDIKDNYVEDSKTLPMLYEFILSKGYRREPHSLHPCYKIDDERTIELWKYYDDKFYTYLFSQIYPEGTHLRELELLKSRYSLGFFDTRPEETLKSIISTIGLDDYKSIVEKYNSELMAKVESGEYPTNNEILGITPSISKNDTVRKEAKLC